MTVPVAVGELAAYLDTYLRIGDIPDEPTALNGLQVESPSAVGWIAAAVDATQATIDGVVAAKKQHAGVPMLLVHHGLFWDGHQPVTGRRYRRLRALLASDTAVYSAHLPLDVHPEVGNNAVLARDLGLSEPTWFDDYRGIPMGIMGRLATDRDALVAQIERRLGGRVQLIPGGPAATARVGIITGAAGGRVRAAHAAGCDTFITGEGPHHTYFDAMELGVNLIYAGHYATEQVGVQALAAHLAERFSLPWEFHDHPTGL